MPPRTPLEQHLFLQFSDNLTLVLDFFTLQDKHNICTLMVYMKTICTRCKKRLEKLAFLPVSKVCTNKFHIWGKLCILHLYLNHTLQLCPVVVSQKGTLTMKCQRLVPF